MGVKTTKDRDLGNLRPDFPKDSATEGCHSWMLGNPREAEHDSAMKLNGISGLILNGVRFPRNIFHRQVALDNNTAARRTKEILRLRFESGLGL